MPLLPLEVESKERSNEPPQAPSPPAQPTGFFKRILLGFRRLTQGCGVRILAASVLGLCVLCLAVFSFYYVRLAHVIDGRLAAGPFSGTTNIYSAAHRVSVGDPLTADQFIAQLQRS